MSWKALVIDDENRYEVYDDALSALAVRTGGLEWAMWHHRLVAFRNNRTSKRTVWLNWVEANAERIPWCGQLVLEAVNQALGIES